MTNNHKSITEGYAVELFLDAEAEAKVLAFRDIIYRAGVQPVQGLMNDKPHISLAVFPRIDSQQLILLTEEYTKRISRFNFRLGAAGTFPTSGNVLFLYPVPSQELLTAHAEFHRSLQAVGLNSSPYYFPGIWVPHLTLEFDITRDELYQSLGIFKDSFEPINGEFTQVGVVGFRPVEYLASFNLKKG